MEKRSIKIEWVMTVILVTLMICLSEVFHEKEFIFPEITALTVGAWLAPKTVWKVSKIKMIVLIAIFASLGVIINAYLPVGMLFKVIIGFICCLVGLSLSKSTFAPLISATILPIIINTTSWLYPAFAALMTVLVALGQRWLERYQGKVIHETSLEKIDYHHDLKIGIQRLLGVVVVSSIAMIIKIPLMVAPPIMVAFVELSNPHPHLRSRFKEVLLLLTIMVFIGGYSRLILRVYFSLPITICALFIVIIMMITMNKMKLFFPPAGALGILPLLIDSSRLVIYPFAVLFGFSCFSIIAFLITKHNYE